VSLLATFLLRLIAAAAGAAIALLFPVERGLVVRVFLLVAGGLALEALVRALAVAEPLRRRERRSRGRRERPEDLARLEDQVALAAANAADLHYRLRPVLREIAEERAAARGIVLDERTAGEAWELVRPDREPPREGAARGLPLAQLARVVDAVEQV